jgi:hypothetical protein
LTKSFFLSLAAAKDFRADSTGDDITDTSSLSMGTNEISVNVTSRPGWAWDFGGIVTTFFLWSGVSSLASGFGVVVAGLFSGSPALGLQSWAVLAVLAGLLRDSSISSVTLTRGLLDSMFLLVWVVGVIGLSPASPKEWQADLLDPDEERSSDGGGGIGGIGVDEVRVSSRSGGGGGIESESSHFGMAGYVDMAVDVANGRDFFSAGGEIIDVDRISCDFLGGTLKSRLIKVPVNVNDGCKDQKPSWCETSADTMLFLVCGVSVA